MEKLESRPRCETRRNVFATYTNCRSKSRRKDRAAYGKGVKRRGGEDTESYTSASIRGAGRANYTPGVMQIK
jgi:hypothetical protein